MSEGDVCKQTQRHKVIHQKKRIKQKIKSGNIKGKIKKLIEKHAC